MQELLIDLKNYKENGSVYQRTAVRGIIERDGKYLVIHSKYGDYKFPGGGSKEGESHIETLAREVAEETGYRLLSDSPEAAFHVKELRKGDPEDKMDMDSYYYYCQVEEMPGQRNLDDYEQEYDYQVVWLGLEELIEKNERVKDLHDIPWVVRELQVMRKVLCL